MRIFAATPPLELNRRLFSKGVSLPESGATRKFLCIDVKKAHLNPKFEQDVYFELPAESGAPPGRCGTQLSVVRPPPGRPGLG